jgi:hypothetical protein
MAANAADKFTKARQNWSGQLDGSGIADESVDSFGLVSAANLPTDTAVYLSIDRIDANGDETNGKWEVVKGVVSGNNVVTSVTRGVEGTAQAHSAGAVVEYLMTASQWNDLYEGLTAEHSQLDGTHTSATVATLKASSAEIITGEEDGKVVTPKGLKDAGIGETAACTGAEIDTGTEESKFATPKAIADSKLLGSNKAWDGWIEAGETWSYKSATEIYASGDVTAKYQKGDKIRYKQGGDWKYEYIIGVSVYDAGNNRTTLTVTGGSDYSVANATITSPHYSKIENPQGFPPSFRWTPTYGGLGSMTFTSVKTDVARFWIIGSTLYHVIDATGTTGGTASNGLTYTVPVPINDSLFSPYNTAANGSVFDSGAKQGWAQRDASQTSYLYVCKYDSSNWGIGTSKRFLLQGFYPI